MAAEPSSHPASSSKRVSQLIDGLKQGESSARWKAAKALSGIGSDAESAIPVLVDALRDRTIIVRVGAAEALGRLGGKATPAVPELIECLRDKYATVRETAAAALGAIGPGACTAIEVLWPLLTDENKYVRAEAERALVQVGSNRACESLDLLRFQLDHSDGGVRAAIARVLGAIGCPDPKIVAGLESLLEDPDSQVRVSAAEAVVNLVPEARTPIPALIQALDDTDPEIRSCAATLLEQIDPSKLKKKTADPKIKLGVGDDFPANQELPANLSSPARESQSAGNALTPAPSVCSSEWLWRIPSLLHLGTLEPRVLHERLIRFWIPVPCTLSTGSDSLSVRPSRLARGPHEVVLTVEPHLRIGRFKERLSLRSPSQTRSIIVQYEMVEGPRPEPRTASARAVIWQPMDWNRIVYDTRMKDLARRRERSTQSDQTGLYGTPHVLPEDGRAVLSPGHTTTRRRGRDYSVENPILEATENPAELLSSRVPRFPAPQPASSVPSEARRGESGAARRVTRTIRLNRVLPVALLGLLILMGASLLWPGKSFLDADPSRPTTEIHKWPVPQDIAKPPVLAPIPNTGPASATFPNAGKVASTEAIKAAGTIEEIEAPTGGSQPMINSVGMRLVLVPPRRFLMGSDDGSEPGASPAHLVELTRPILVGQFEVTQAEWNQVMGSKPGAWFNAERLMGLQTTADAFPVDSVTWFDAIRFCNRLSEREQLPPYYTLAGEVTIPDQAGPGYRLPTESEWESFCRGTSTTRWFFGDRPSDLEAYAVFAVNSREQTHPVGSKRPNSYTLYDVYGNVAEWCWDWMGEYSKEPIVDPTGPPKGRYRILRGGAWDTYESDISTANRSSMLPEKPNRSNGFRVVRNLLERGKK